MNDKSQTYEADLAIFVQLLEGERENLWAQADWALHMTGTYGRKTAQMLATDSGLSAAYVRQLVVTAKMFPEERRADDLSFSHHKIAAMTQDPDGWIQKAITQELSVKELGQAVADSKDRISGAEEARRAAERLIQAVNKFNQRYAQIAGQQAVITWESLTLLEHDDEAPAVAQSA